MISDIIFHRDFPAAYDCAPLIELPGVATDLLYFNTSCRSGTNHDGLLAMIEPMNGEAWMGVFEWGSPSPDSSLSGFWSLPNKDHVCAVSRGVAYIVSAADAGKYTVVPLRPICHVLPVPSADLIVFGDFTKLSAFGKGGHIWTTPRLSWDGLEISGVEGSRVVGTRWDAPSQARVGFSVDLETGCHEGGAITGVRSMLAE